VSVALAICRGRDNVEGGWETEVPQRGPGAEPGGCLGANTKFLTVTSTTKSIIYHVKHMNLVYTNSVCRQCESNSEFNKQTHLFNTVIFLDLCYYLNSKAMLSQ